MNNCPKCGKELPAGVKFCKYCGAQLTAPANVQIQQEAPTKKSSKTLIIAIVAVLLVALIVLGVLFIPDLLDKKGEEESTKKENQVVTDVGSDKEIVTKPNEKEEKPVDDVDIYMAPNGKYYVPVKISYYYDGEIDEIEALSWNSDSVSVTSYNANIEYKFDSNAKIISETLSTSYSSPIQFMHTYTNGLITQTKRSGDFSVVSTYEYDNNNNLVKKVRTEIGTSEGGTYTDEFVYDNNNRLVKYISGDDQATLTYKSDKAFEFVGFGASGTAEYNELGKIKKATLIAGAPTDITYSYDANQNLSSVFHSSANSGVYSVQIEWAEATEQQAIFAEYIINDVLSMGGNFFFYYHYPDNDHILYNFIY